jgi:hypothetical protein
MKPSHFAIPVLFASLFVFCAPTTGPAAEWRTFGRVSYDWRGDSVPYDFVLRVPTDEDLEDLFTQLEIIRHGEVVFTVIDKDGIMPYTYTNETGDIKKITSRNLLHSEHLLMVPTIKGRSRFPLLFMFGRGGPAEPGSVHVISLSDAGDPKEILSLNKFAIHNLADLNNDSVPELIGKKCFSQGWGEGNKEFLTYAPFSVYRFGDTAISPMIFDLALSREYNEAHYYGWAGPHCRGDLVVVLHPPGGGKPVIMDKKKAEALLKK